MQTLTFQNITLAPAKIDSQIWLSSADLAKALGYSRADSVTRLYNENSDEFRSDTTTLIDNPQMKNAKIRIFSLRGCHLIAMFARTKIAKEFRKWVLDILDKEVGEPVQVKTTVNDRTPLRQAVSMLVGKKGLAYDEAYQMVHQFMGVSHIDEIDPSELPRAIAYVHSLTLETNTPKYDLADLRRQNQKAQTEFDDILVLFNQSLDRLADLKIRLDRQDRLIRTFC
ncbi:alpha/beta hydrolase [Moraxella bovis]|uniref:BRO-N domain-containing protein n=1 Tax=Moraxella bovis TaxID=476 RepID=UPI002225C677|nr:BRO family protein [Moraxella bovis]UYZ74527.1 alpha/beta hydrolase [Moraxella bovis]